MSAHFPLLADPSTYRPCVWDLGANPERRKYWLDQFRAHLPSVLSLVLEGTSESPTELEGVRARADLVAQDFFGYLDSVEQDPTCFGGLDILEICKAREAALRKHGFSDPYDDVKQRENEAALERLPGVLESLESLAPEARLERLVRGIFAGNIFDLGATDIAEKLHGTSVDFTATLHDLPPRPWLVDHLDAFAPFFASRLDTVVLFVDNAGCDLVLGMLPFTRELLRRGTHVILAANNGPALNDITFSELGPLVERVAELDPITRTALNGGTLELVPSGSLTPLIDLEEVSSELALAVRCHPPSLVVLEGMGRALQSNYDAVFRCPALKIAMVKDRDVARWLGGSVYDLVFRFDPT